jgi:hypothetical protein
MDANATINEMEENIRQPDQVITETLVYDSFDDHYDNITEYDNELNRIINLSTLELKYQEDQEDMQILRLISAERENILHKFSTIKDKINKMYKIDKVNSSIYEDILSYIELHDITHNLYYELEKENYDKIFNCINRLRFTNEEKILLKDLLIII